MQIVLIGKWPPPLPKLIRIMKLMIILLTVTGLQLSANSFSQTVTLSLKNASIKTLLREIQKQTDMDIMVDEALLHQMNPVTIKVRNISVNEVLDRCFANQPFNYKVENNTITIERKKDAIPLSTTKQLLLPLTVPVSGKITDDQMIPLSGVSITVRNKPTSGTSTAADGRFSIEAEEGDLLVITSVGHFGITAKITKAGTGHFTASVIDREKASDEVKQKKSDTISMNNESIGLSRLNVLGEYQDVSDNSGNTSFLNLHFILVKKNIALNEVMINTGIQTLPRSRSTGAFEKLTSSEIQLQVGANILERMNGMVAGVRFDNVKGRPPITVRGLSTINSPQSPLIVLDNFPYDGDINNINPNDIESITVLKDAAAASIWGARAGNGVIVITTKKAGKGDPVKWQFNNTFRVTAKPDLFYSPETINPADQTALEQELFKKGFYTANEANVNKPALPPVVEYLIAARDGRISQAEADAGIAALSKNDLRSQATDLLYEKPIYQQYNLQVSGGGQQYAFNLSGGYDKTLSNLGAINERYTLRSYGRIGLGRRVNMDANVQYTNTNSKNGRPEVDDVRTGQYRTIYKPLQQADGNMLAWSPTYRRPYTDTAGRGKLLDWNYYPLEDYLHDIRKISTDHLLVALGINANLIKGLQLQMQGRLERSHSNNEQFQDKESYGARNYINLYTQVDAGGNYSYGIPVGGIVRNSFSVMQAFNLRGQLNYNKQWNEHQLELLGGAEIRQTENSSTSSIAYGFDPNVLTTQKVDYLENYRNYVSGSTGLFVPDNTGFSGTLFRYASWYGNAGYTYKQRYSFTASARRDASNLFGVNANEKGIPLWSAGLGWDIHKEGWMNKIFSRLRLRLTTGFSGNIDPARSALTVIRIISANTLNNQRYARVDQYANPDLRWEKVQTHNLGIDFEITGKRIWGSLDMYMKKGHDLFGPKPVDPTVGIPLPSVPANMAAMKGHGMELTLHTLNIKGVVTWQTTALISMSDNKITEYLNTSATGSSYIKDGRLINEQVGAPVYSVVSYAWAGLDPINGDPMGLLNKQPSKDYSKILGTGTTLEDVIQHGSAVPVWYGALRNDLSWKGLSLTVNITWSADYYFRRSVMTMAGLYGGFGHMDYYKRWQRPGDEALTNVPSLAYPVVSNRDAFYRNSEVTVSKGDHIRLQFIEAAYQFKLGKWLRQPQRFFVNVSNLGLIWKANKEGLDPEYTTMKPPVSVAAGINLSW